MAWLYHFNQIVTHGMEGFLETAVPMISGLAEIIGLFIIVTSLVKATYHYVRATFFHGQHDFLHEMSSGLTTALEFLMSAEIAKTFLLDLPAAESGIGGAVGGHLCPAGHDEPDAPLGDGGRAPLRPQKGRNACR